MIGCGKSRTSGWEDDCGGEGTTVCQGSNILECSYVSFFFCGYLSVELT